jgi:hypothetical protein
VSKADHIAAVVAEKDAEIERLIDERDGAQVRIETLAKERNAALARAEKAEAERDAWRCRHRLIAEHRWDEIAAKETATIERCAQVVDECNREGPYNAIGAASRIRALAKPAAKINRDKLVKELLELRHIEAVVAARDARIAELEARIEDLESRMAAIEALARPLDDAAADAIAREKGGLGD